MGFDRSLAQRLREMRKSMGSESESEEGTAGPGQEDFNQLKTEFMNQAARSLWEERYRDELRDYAFKNRYLHEDQDPDDLFQDLAINVWMKTINTFDPTQVTFTEDLDRAFNAYFHQWLNRYLANLATHRDTGKSQYFREKRKGEVPSGEEDVGPSLIDRLADESTEDPELNSDLQMLFHRLPDDLSAPLQYIIQNLSTGDTNQVLQEVRDKWGWTLKRLTNALLEEPEFVDFVTNI